MADFGFHPSQFHNSYYQPPPPLFQSQTLSSAYNLHQLTLNNHTSYASPCYTYPSAFVGYQQRCYDFVSPPLPKPPDMMESGREFNQSSSLKVNRLPQDTLQMLKKIFPAFDGLDVRDWIFKCEQFFRLNVTDEDAKVRLATIQMSGRALQWHYEYITNRYGVYPSWSEYSEVISKKFSGIHKDSMTVLLSVEQVHNSVEDTLAPLDLKELRPLSQLLSKDDGTHHAFDEMPDEISVKNNQNADDKSAEKANQSSGSGLIESQKHMVERERDENLEETKEVEVVSVGDLNDSMEKEWNNLKNDSDVDELYDDLCNITSPDNTSEEQEEEVKNDNQDEDDDTYVIGDTKDVKRGSKYIVPEYIEVQNYYTFKKDFGRFEKENVRWDGDILGKTSTGEPFYRLAFVGREMVAVMAVSTYYGLDKALDAKERKSFKTWKFKFKDVKEKASDIEEGDKSEVADNKGENDALSLCHKESKSEDMKMIGSEIELEESKPKEEKQLSNSMKRFWMTVNELKQGGFYMDEEIYKTIYGELTKEKLKTDDVVVAHFYERMLKENEISTVAGNVFIYVLKVDWSYEVEKEWQVIKLALSDNFVIRVLKELRDHPLKALAFSHLAGGCSSGYQHNTITYNAALGVLARPNLVPEFWSVVDEMKTAGHKMDLDTYLRMMKEVLSHLPEFKSTIADGLNHHNVLWENIAEKFETWKHMVRKEEAIYHTLNMLSIDVSKKCLVSGDIVETKKNKTMNPEVDMDPILLASLRKRVTIDTFSVQKNIGIGETATPNPNRERRKSKYLSPNYLLEFSRKGIKKSKLESESSKNSSPRDMVREFMSIYGSFTYHDGANHKNFKGTFELILDLRMVTPQILLNYALLFEKNKYFEDVFKVYERGVKMFKYPHVNDIWVTYLTKFVKRYGKTKLERARELYEHAVSVALSDADLQILMETTDVDGDAFPCFGSVEGHSWFVFHSPRPPEDRTARLPTFNDT